MQHASLTVERWSRFTLGQQLLMIANEMNRAAKLHAALDRPSLKLALERVLNLTDATVVANDRPGLRRELLRWRDLVAGQFVAAEPDPARHQLAFRALLMLHPDTYQQLRMGLLGGGMSSKDLGCT